MQSKESRPNLMTSEQYKVLAERYIVDGEILLNARRWSSAYYLAGYSVECGLKACAAKRIRAECVPDKTWITNFFTHKLVHLVTCAGLEPVLKKKTAESPSFHKNWSQAVLKWHSEARYAEVSQATAQELLRAVKGRSDGVLPWLETFW